MNIVKKNIITNKDYVFYFFLYWFSYFGLGAYFVSLSPYMVQKFGNDAKYIFLAGQLGFPLGYFFSGWISDKTKKIRIYGVIFSLLLIPSQYFLFEPKINFFLAFLFSFSVRFLFAANTQILQIAVLEKLYYLGFSISRAAGTFGFFLMQVLMFFLEMYYFPHNVSLELQSSRGGQIASWIHILTFLFSFYLPPYRKSENPYYFKQVLNITIKNHIWLFFVISFLYYFSYQIVDFYLGAYYHTSLGGMKYVYLSWVIAVIIEIPFFPLTQKIIHKYGLKILFQVSLLAGIIRFFFLTIHNVAFSGYWILITQILHGIHFTGYMAGSIYFFHKKFPEHLYGTAYGLYIIFSLSSGSIIGSFVYGIILQFYDYYIIFLLTSLIHLLLFIINIYNKKIDILLK